MGRITSTTNELERQFFDTFGIKPKYTYLVTDTFYTDDSHTYGATKNDLIDCFEGKNCGRYKVVKVYKTYYQITSDRLLELVCVLTRFYGELVLEQCLDVKDLKEQVLNIFIRTSYKDNFKHQVRKLFKEER